MTYVFRDTLKIVMKIKRFGATQMIKMLSKYYSKGGLSPLHTIITAYSEHMPGEITGH